MSQPLVIAHHILWTCYGSWLPNDPRGSTSKAIRSDVIADLGDLHFGRRAIQPTSREIREFYREADDLLSHERLEFSADGFNDVADCFALTIKRHAYTCYACAVMPDHVHLLIRKHKHSAEQMIDHLKEESAIQLRESGLRPATHPVWTAEGGWKVFLDHPQDVRRTIRYIERNPVPLRLPVQRYEFVKPYDDWPFHEGHSPNSPYAKALKAVGRYPIGKRFHG